MFGPGGSLFGGMNVHSMSVNFNMGQGGLPIDAGVNGMHINHNNMMLPNNQPVVDNLRLIGNESSVETVEAITYMFDDVYIDGSYNIHFRSRFDMKKNKPKGEFKALNDSYCVSVELEDIGEWYEGKFGEVITRDGKYPPILYLLDYLKEEDLAKVDQMIYHTMLLAKHYNHNSFFIVFEESGIKEIGEPHMTVLNPMTALCSMVVRSIAFK